MIHFPELELQETLEASEKLMANLNESWEDKLAKTQEIHVAREQALEELGISLDKDRALVGVHAPKRWPHLVNLNEVKPRFLVGVMRCHTDFPNSLAGPTAERMPPVFDSGGTNDRRKH